jgi:UDP-N-acetylglucosamine--N-acetylmuramyl-(pentapeptide) pyrophosphoryl-undecaprenol N-acetylglucosamine transferase
MRVLISGGGTGGHVFPAIAIADAIKAKQPDAEFLFIGANGKIEMQKVPAAGYKIIGLDVKGFQRKLTFDNIKTVAKAGIAMIKALSIVRSFKPDIAIGVGGYASGPTLKVASWLGIPTMLQEQNSFAGVTNKLLAKKAKMIFVAYEGMERFFDKDKIILTGNPVRSNIISNQHTQGEAKAKLGIDPKHTVVLLMGGSLGARTINKAMQYSYDLVSKSHDTTFIWQVGKLYMEEFKNQPVSKLPNVRAVDFIEDMPTVYAAVDLIVGRAGALTIAELALVGKPSILVPSPNVSEDHQTHNANALVSKGAALLVKDVDAEQNLLDTVFSTLDDKAIMSKLSQNIIGFAKAQAADDIAHHIIKYLNDKS